MNEMVKVVISHEKLTKSCQCRHKIFKLVCLIEATKFAYVNLLDLLL